jgi:hypothetical protein
VLTFVFLSGNKVLNDVPVYYFSIIFELLTLKYLLKI